MRTKALLYLGAGVVLGGLLLAAFTFRSPPERGGRPMLAALGAGGFGYLALAWLVFDRRFVRRISALEERVKNLRGVADFAALESTPGRDEIATLSRDVGRMARGLSEARHAAEAAARAKGEFLATMSHEIRTPMNGVLGFTSLLKGTPLTAEQTQFVETIEQSGATLLALINDILDLSKFEAGKLELERQPVALRALADEIGGVFAARLREKGLAFSAALAPGAPGCVEADAVRLRQVLFNLVGNAIKFTARGGVTLDLSLRDGGASPGDACVLLVRVTDTGIGLSAEQQARLFQPFMQADSTTTRLYGGTGLGLAISKRLVEAMGGAISVSSERGRGATFWFTLPTRVLVPVQSASPLPAAVAAPTRPLRLLVAEDNAVNRAMIAAMLRRLGRTADFAEDGRAALVLLQAPRPYDAVLMDVQMPELDGLDCTRALREHEHVTGTARARVIALTAGAMAGDRDRCLAAGMDDYLTKPLRLEELHAALDRVTPALAMAAAE